MTVETSGDEMYFVITPEFRNQYEAYKKKE
jgi:hypothetical protein